jgi:hypothetical protein
MAMEIAEYSGGIRNNPPALWSFGTLVRGSLVEPTYAKPEIVNGGCRQKYVQRLFSSLNCDFSQRKQPEVDEVRRWTVPGAQHAQNTKY